ncbi:DoxX family protein (plasmid) [Rhizobium sp. CB3171]|uniref:DoxX family protein n=1 Tax=Rhizobium sp. CB3171 TaxID=3039157 RepID=UPI0024B209C5|nr:DoxX family protein [Rhizobium sp. CB3171]WFU07236.1 DoxX family protein [Rhizobium sp. CB3171]
MQRVATTRPIAKAKTIAIWIMRIVLGLAFIAFAVMKLSGQPEMVAEFELVGLGQWFRHFTGILELIGGIALLVPRTSIMAALLLLAVDVGAFIAQVTVLHIDWIHTVVLGAIIVLLIYLQRAGTAQLRGGR